MKNKRYIYIISGIVLFLDQVAKLLIQKTMSLYEEVVVIPNFFSILYVKNSGAAFSILENSTLLLILISAMVLIMLGRYIKKGSKEFHRITTLSLGLVIGGIFGNLIDRVFYRSVIDFLSFTIFQYRFAIFNIADIGITVGTILLVIDLFKEKNINQKKI